MENKTNQTATAKTIDMKDVFNEVRQLSRKYLSEYGKDLLQKYSMWLTKNGYMDTDWKDEEPFAIDEFLKTLK